MFAALTAILSGCGGDCCEAEDEPLELNVSFKSIPPPLKGLEATLCGTLTLPSSNSQNVPAVVLLPGTEPVNRNLSLSSVPALDSAQDNLDGTLDGRLTFSPAVDLFRQMSDFLAENGYAVLRYDNRIWLSQNGSPCGETPGSSTYTTYAEDFIADAENAVALVKARPEVDEARVYVIGHALGAHVALQLAATDQVRGAVLLGLGARPVDTLILERLQRQLTYLRTLTPSNAINEAIAAVQADLQAAQRDFPRVRAGRFLITDVLLAWSRFYWESWVPMTDRTLQTFGAVEGALLLLHGNLDSVVPVSELGRFGTPGQTGRITLQGAPVTHALTSGAQGQVNQDVLNSIRSWLGSH